MARDIFGNKIRSKDERNARKMATEADIRWEYVKMFLWIFAGISYMYYLFRS